MDLDEGTVVRVIEENGHNVNDFISQVGLFELLNRLNGEPFDDDIFDQLWSQCKQNSLGQIQLREFVDTLMRARKILVDQNNQAVAELTRLEQQIKAVEKQHMAAKDFRTRAERQRKIVQLEELAAVEKQKKADYNINLQIIKKPFATRHRSAKKVTESPVRSVVQPPVPQQNNPSTDSFNDLRCVLLAVIPMMLAQCILMFQKTDFLNLLFYCSVLLIFIIINVDRTYIRVTLGILVMSVVTDLLWMAVYAGKLWSPPTLSEYPRMTETFRRVCLVVTFTLIFGKLFIGMLLLKYRDIERPMDVKMQLLGEQARQSDPANQPTNFITSSFAAKPSLY